MLKKNKSRRRGHQASAGGDAGPLTAEALLAGGSAGAQAGSVHAGSEAGARPQAKAAKPPGAGREEKGAARTPTKPQRQQCDSAGKSYLNYLYSNFYLSCCRLCACNLNCLGGEAQRQTLVSNSCVAEGACCFGALTLLLAL